MIRYLAILLVATLAFAPQALASDDDSHHGMSHEQEHGEGYEHHEDHGDDFIRGKPVRAGDLIIDSAWARPSLGRAPNSAAFFRVRNDGAEDDLLTAAKSPVAERVEIHAHSMADGVMRMRPVDAVEVPSGTSVEFAPGGLHIMLIGLKGKLDAGGQFPLTLVFRDAGEVTLQVQVTMSGYES